MKITLVPYGVVPRVAVRAFVSAGGVNEGANQVWLSRLTGLLMKEGTKTRSAEQIAADAADAGGQVEIEPGVEFTSVGGVALSDHALPFIQVVADVLRNPSLPAAQVERLKADLLRELAVAHTQPQSLARERFLQTMFPDSPYGRVFPSETELKGYTAEDAQSLLPEQFQCGAHSSLRGGPVRSRSSGGNTGSLRELGPGHATLKRNTGGGQESLLFSD